MTRKLLATLGVGMLACFVSLAEPARPAAKLRSERLVAVACAMPDPEFVALSATLAAINPRAILLRDGAGSAAANHAFLAAYHPHVVVPVGSIKSATDVEKRLGTKVAAPLAWRHGPEPATWHALFPSAESIVVCPADQRALLLHAACLAGALRVPLVLERGREGEAESLQELMTAWKTSTVYRVGSVAHLLPEAKGVNVVSLTDELAVARVYRRFLGQQGAVRSVVLANPADALERRGQMSLLGPWIALQKQALLVLTDSAGTNAGAAVQKASDEFKIQPDTLVIAATPRAIPTERRPNPVQGKDVDIEMEPLTPKGEEPFSFATGRVFHEDPAIVLLQLARNEILKEQKRPRRALVVSNPGGGLPLLETFSRHTSRELRNGGYLTTAWFGDQVSADSMRKALPSQDVFLWEGHYRTLIDDFGFLSWTEPLPPALFFLQSCLALKESEAGPLFQRGAVAVVGSSTRTYSATGGAFTLAFFNALMYDDQPLGGALRQAKNFLLLYSLLKEKRLGERAKLKGVNVRSSWAFTLWGDPTLKLPQTSRNENRLDSVRHELKGSRLTIHLPDRTYETVHVEKYEAQMLPNARMAGLLKIDAENEDNRFLVPFVFAEVRLPKVPAGATPRLKSRIPGRNWVFTWDSRRKTGYVLVTPRAKDEGELHFKVDYENDG